MGIRVADYIAKTLADHGIHHIFMITGGGAMFLNNAFGQEKRLNCIFQHHEQASAMAAEGYARVTGKLAVVNVTSGPGGINALNGVFGAWTDAIPMLVISGQIKRETCMSTCGVTGLRQLGDQESDIIGIVKGITKYAALVDDPLSIRYHLEKALYLSLVGPPGPCWLDIPLDVQSCIIDKNSLHKYDQQEDLPSWDLKNLPERCQNILEKITKAKRPVIMAGTGIRLAHAFDIFDEVINKLRIPVTTSWTHDVIASDDPLFCGRPGTIGTRAGNFTVQNSDLLLILGARLNIRQISYNWQSFAREAFKIQVDADYAEFKRPMVKIDMPVHCDILLFLEELNRQIDCSSFISNQHKDWLGWCHERVLKYPAVLERHRRFNGKINPYYFIEVLFSQLNQDDTIVCANASACIIPWQAASLKKGQRLFSNSGSASMGYDLPAAIGAAIAQKGKRVICLAGDGSIQMNIQELQTIIHYGLPVKIFVFNNDGYLSIRTTQNNFFSNLTGEGPESGVSFPDIVKIAQAYGLPAYRIDSPEFPATTDEIIKQSGPALCEVMLDPDQTFDPKISSRQLSDGRIVSATLEDMYPFLDRQEFLENMWITSQED
ncbi:MAG: thiamine pyrophosphate-binding protein [Smithella sp.]